MSSSSSNPFSHLLRELDAVGVGGASGKRLFFDLKSLGGDRFAALPFSVRVLLESAVRNCGGFQVKQNFKKKK